MKYAGIIVLAVLLGVAGALPAAAQQRETTAVDRLFSQVMGEDDERQARRPTVVIGDRNAEQRDDTRRRGRTSRDQDGDRGERTRTGSRTDGDARGDRTERADRRTERTQRADRTERRDTRTTSRDGDYDRSGDYERGREARQRGNDRRGVYGQEAGQKRGNGPPFCRSGEGHPKHGMKWCYDKGWGGGNRGIFDTRREDRRYPTRTNERTILDDILGRRNN